MIAEGRVATGPKRRLAAVLCADVEGFSRLCGEDEADTLRMFERHIDELFKPTVRANGGRITNTAGDGLVVEFGSAVAAVNAAIEIQRGMGGRNEPVPSARRLRFRIGINLCEVVVQQREIFGDGVNIAARTQALAPADAICVTESVFQQVRGKIATGFRSMGKIRLKNITDPIHIYQLSDDASSESGASGAAGRGAGLPTTKPSIAVLPFNNFSDDPGQSYFSDGIAEDLITDLSRFRTLSVIARNSSFVYRGQQVDVRAVGRDLGVRFVIEGSVRKMHDTVRITVQLVSAETAHHVWAERYDAPLADLFRTQDEIVRRVIGRLLPRIEDEGLVHARRQPTEMLQAYDHYLRGKAALYGATDAAGTEQAQRHFEKAIEIDPEFAYPYCYLVRILNNVTMHDSPGRSLAPFREQAWKYAKVAEALDDADPHTHICLAWCHLWRREFEQARQHLEIAGRLNPNDADRAMDRGSGWMYLGEIDRAIECMLTGISLNPHHPASYLADLAEAYFVAGRYTAMLELLERITDQSLLSSAWKAAGYALSGQEAKAETEASRFVTKLSAIWAGDPKAGTSEYVDWVMSLSPFYRDEDRDHLLLGLRLAGLATPLGFQGRVP